MVPLLFALTLLSEPRLGADWIWDTGNAIGYLALGALLYLFLDPGLGPRQRLHRWIGYLAAGAVALHALWLLLLDPTLWYYLSPGAPAGMLLGLAALVLLLGLVLLAAPAWKRWFEPDAPTFRRWHWTLAALVLTGSCWHVLGSRLYVSSIEATLVCGLALIIVIGQRFRWWPRSAAPGRVLALLPLLAVVFVLVKRW